MSECKVRKQVGAVIADAYGNILVLKRNPERYTGIGFVKGGIEPGESLEQAVQREIAEEAGIGAELVSSINQLEKRTAHYHDRLDYIGFVEWFFVATRVQSIDQLTLCPEEWHHASFQKPDTIRSQLTWQTERLVFDVVRGMLD